MYRPDYATTPPRRSELWRKSMIILLVVTAYWVISMSMVFINKYLLSSEDLKLDAPLFVTWCQCICTMGLCYGFGKVGLVFPDKNYFEVPYITIDRKVAFQVLPLSIIFTCMITCNNLCLKYVTVAFYNVGRSLTTVFNLIFTYFILHERTSIKAVMCCALLIGGFVLGIDQEKLGGSLSWLGVIFGTCASSFVALNAIFTKRTLPFVENNIWRLQFYNNLNASILFLPLMLVFGEFPVIASFEKLFTVQFFLLTALAGTFGFLIGFITGLQIKVTSPLTHNISGTAKACFQTLIAVIWYNDAKTFLWWLSNVVVLLSSTAYTQVRHSEMQKNHNSAVKEMPLISVADDQQDIDNEELSTEMADFKLPMPGENYEVTRAVGQNQKSGIDHL